MLGDLDRMVELIEKINKHNDAYYKNDNPTISDAEYDKLYDELVELEASTNTVYPESPTKKVGGEILKGFSSHSHIVRLYSLAKCKTREDVSSWASKNNKIIGQELEYTLEYKYDGLTLNLTYDKGSLILAVTRGNGEKGEIVTNQVKSIHNIPKSIPFKGKCEIQGEAIMRLSALADYNEKAEVPLKNARNAAAGAIRNLNPEETKKRNLDAFFYSIGYIEGEYLSSQEATHNFLVKNGFDTGTFFEKYMNIDLLVDDILKVDLIRNDLDYLIDGMVIKVNSIEHRNELGYTDKFPRWAMAYKFKAEEKTTILLDVKWQVSRTSKLNPLAVLEPVEIGGATVRHATLNNYTDIIKKDIKINSRVFIRRSNDVIPEILGIAEHMDNSQDILKPNICPACGAKVREEGSFLYCTNTENCAPQIISTLGHYASKQALDIEGLSDKTAEQLYNELQVKTPADLYRLTKEDLLQLDGFKERKVANLLASINKSKKPTLASFIMGLGIPNIGKKSARDLAIRYTSIDNFLHAKYEELIEIKDFGEIMARGVESYLQDSISIINELIEQGIEVQDEKIIEGIFRGMKVVLTGSLSSFSRSEIGKIISDNGGEVSGSISNQVNLVIAGEKAGSKLAKASVLGIRIINEKELIKMLEIK